MSFTDDFFDSDANSFIDDEKLKYKVQKCKEYVTSGQTINYLGNIEDTIQLCLEYDFTEDGIFLVEAALEISPYSSELWHSKGIFYNNLFEFEKAFLCFNKSLSLNPSDVEAMINKSIAEDNLGMWDEAISTLEKALQIEPHNEEVLFNLGIFYERKDYLQKAIEFFTQTLAIDPDYADAWYELGFCYESNHQLEDAIKAYEKFLEIEPYNAGGWYNYGIVLLRLENYSKAINSFELATAINEDFANAWYNCGLAYSKLSMLTESRNAFLKAFELDPFDDSIPYNIAQSYEAIGEYNLAIRYYEETLNISKSNVDAYIGLGNCFARLNDRTEMLKNFSASLKYSLIDELPVYSLNESEREINKLFKDIRKYINSKQKRIELADCYFDLGRWEDAIDYYLRALELKSESALIHYNLSMSYFMLNENEKAIEHLITSFQLNPGNEISFLDNFPQFESTQLYINLTDSIIS